MENIIKKLAKESGQGTTFHIPPEFVEKFSKRLLEECCDVIIKNKIIGENQYYTSYEEQLETRFDNSTREDSVKEIKKVFGF